MILYQNDFLKLHYENTLQKISIQDNNEELNFYILINNSIYKTVQGKLSGNPVILNLRSYIDA